ncbi:MAG: hypothetical protein H7841_02810 [Magnetospirillum sp. WYHS-4]
MSKPFRHTRIAMLIGLGSLGLSACTMNDLAGLADAMYGAGPYGGVSGYPAQPAYAAPPSPTYYPVVVQAPNPAHAYDVPARSRNPYAAPDRRDDRSRREHGRNRDRGWR